MANPTYSGLGEWAGRPGVRARVRSHRGVFYAVLVVLIGAGALAAHSLLGYPSFFFDDAFISLRYADRLRTGQGLTWTDGERVEGYTNFLWVVLVGAVGLVSPGLIWVARILGLLSSALAIAAIGWAYRPKRPVEIVGPLWAALAIGLSGPVAAWSIGGLEHPLLIALIAWSIALLYPALDAGELPWRRSFAPGLLLGLACLTRPDAPLFAVMLAFGFAAGSRFRRPALGGALRLLVVPALSIAAHVLFRRVYYGAWLPNTSSKLGLSSERLHGGLEYIMAHWELRLGLLYPALLALVACIISARARRRVLLVGSPLIAWLAYVVTLGGDFMPQRRHLVPAILLLAFIGSEALSWMTRRRFGGPAAAWLIGPVAAVHLGIAQQRDPAMPDANRSEWYWDARPIGLFFRDAFGDRDPLLAVDAAGALPYFSELRTLDMLGLNDRYLATHPPPRVGVGPVAHALGDGRYVLDRKPDLVVFHLPYGQEHGLWKSGREMKRSPEFGRLYRLVRYRTDRVKTVRGMVWVRQIDGPLGIERAPNRVVVPGWLFSDDAGSFAEKSDAGRVGVRIYDGEPASYAGLELEPGRWRFTLDATGGLQIELRAAGRTIAVGSSPIVFESPASGRVDVRLALASGLAAHVYQVTLDRASN